MNNASLPVPVPFNIKSSDSRALGFAKSINETETENRLASPYFSDSYTSLLVAPPRSPSPAATIVRYSTPLDGQEAFRKVIDLGANGPRETDRALFPDSIFGL